MTDLRQAAQALVDALSETAQWDATDRQVAAVWNLRAALAQPKAEPVLYWHKPKTDEQEFVEPEAVNGDCPDCVPLYTHPPAERRPVADSELRRLQSQLGLHAEAYERLRDFTRAVERHHGIGETK